MLEPGRGAAYTLRMNPHIPPGRSNRPELATTIALSNQDRIWGTERRMALLAAIGAKGSIAAAARDVGLSYKAAWDAVDAMNNLAGEALVLRSTGGKHGGGATLTPRAHSLIAWYAAIQQEHRRFTDLLARIDPDSPKNLELIQHMMIRTSARNQLIGTIRDIKPGAVNDEITLQTDEGVTIVSTITHVSAQNLELSVGRRVMAFIKAPSVMIGLPETGMRLSARNQLNGRIGHITEGAVQAEVGVDVGDTTRITAMISIQSVRAMGLAVGQAACAIFESSNVLLGIMD